MGIFSKKQEVIKRVFSKPTYIKIKESKAKTVLTTTDYKISKEIGEPHPFDYTITEGLYLKLGILSGMIDKIIDFVWGPGFHTESTDKRAKTIIDQWVQDTSFDTIGRKWLRESLIKGSGYLEISGKPNEVPSEVKNLNANHIYVKRNDTGDVLGYTQAIKQTGRINEKDIISFKPEEIAHLNHNQLGDLAYGWGLIYPSITTINNMLQIESDMHNLIHRKANSPMVVYVGNPADPDSIPDEETVNAIADKLQFMNEKTEWVFPADMKAEKIDFGNIGEKFTEILSHNLNLLIFGFQVPEVLLGKGNIPEGIAKVQLDAFERRIKSIQSEIEKVIETKIFKRVLLANGLDVHVEIVWGQASTSEINEKISRLQLLLTNPMLGMKLRVELEKQLATLLNIDISLIEEDKDEREREENESQPIVPGQNNPKQSLQCNHSHENQQTNMVIGKLIY